MSSVLISGGGIGGLCTRLALKQLGVSSDLFDLAPAIVKPDSDEPLLLLPNATRILVDMGFSPLVGKAQTVDRWTILNTKGQVLGGANFAQLSAEHAGGTAAVVMRSNDLLSAMLKAGAGTKGVMSPVRVAAGLNNLALQGDGTLLASFTARIPERAVTLVVGADGVPSKVRELRCGPPTADGDVQVPFPGWGFWSWEAPPDVASALQLHAGRRVLEVWGKGVRLRASPLANKGAHLTATVQHQRPTPPGRTPAAMVGELAKQLAPLATAQEAGGVVGDAASEPGADALGPAIAMAVERVTQNPKRARLRFHYPPSVVIDSASYPAAIPVALVGDAAHAMPPTLFQGPALALEDGWTLARAVAPDGELIRGAALGTAVQQWALARAKKAATARKASDDLVRLANSLGGSGAPGGSGWLGGMVERLRGTLLPLAVHEKALHATFARLLA